MDEIFLLGILLLESCILLIYAWKTNKYTDYSFSLLIMYGNSYGSQGQTERAVALQEEEENGSFYMFRHYITIIRERS
jgi:hypothetical protein